MVELLERRVTRSLSNELQARAAITPAQNHQAQAQLPLQFAHGNSRSPNRSNSITLGNRAEADCFSFEPPPFCHTTSEEIFLRTVVDGAIAQSSPTMDGLGLSNLPPASRRNSEELFSTWISNQERQVFSNREYKSLEYLDHEDKLRKYTAERCQPILLNLKHFVRAERDRFALDIYPAVQ